MKRVGFFAPVCEPMGPPVLACEGSARMRSGRVMWRMLDGVEVARVGWSGGTNTPSWRKDLMFDMRIREEAEGERRMMGSGRREDDGPGRPDFLGTGRPADGAGTPGGLLPGLTPGGYWPVRERLRPRKASAVLRTCEKSCSS